MILYGYLCLCLDVKFTAVTCLCVSVYMDTLVRGHTCAHVLLLAGPWISGYTDERVVYICVWLHVSECVAVYLEGIVCFVKL